MEELISKKELLKQTGISYGQLYRWKRQRLIPEAWFMKQSSFTGQETFFPRKQILERISTILKLKDQYSLDELAAMLTPALSKRTFKLDELEQIFGFGSKLYRQYTAAMDQVNLSFGEVILLEAMRKAMDEYAIDDRSVTTCFSSIKFWMEHIHGDMNFRFILCEQEGRKIILLVDQQAKLFFDVGMTVLKEISLEEITKEIQFKIKTSLGE